jgi:hypothetical protein
MSKLFPSRSDGEISQKKGKIILVAVNVDREAYSRAIDLGIDVVCGNVIDF